MLDRPIFNASAPKARLYGRRMSNGWTQLDTLFAGMGISLYGYRVHPIAALERVMAGQRWICRFERVAPDMPDFLVGVYFWPAGCDAGKKVSGIKRHIDVEPQGPPHAVTMTTAEVTNRKGALETLERWGAARRNSPLAQSVLCDGGSTGEPFAQGLREILGEQVRVQIAKRSELHTFKIMPLRRVVERRVAWLKQNRKWRKNCARLPDTSLQFVQWAFLALLLTRA